MTKIGYEFVDRLHRRKKSLHETLKTHTKLNCVTSQT